MALVADEAAILARIRDRCPAIEVKDRAELGKRTPRPAFDVTAPDGVAAVSRDKARKHVNALEASEARKGETGSRIANDYDRCRGAVAQPPVAASVNPRHVAGL